VRLNLLTRFRTAESFVAPRSSRYLGSIALTIRQTLCVRLRAGSVVGLGIALGVATLVCSVPALSASDARWHATLGRTGGAGSITLESVAEYHSFKATRTPPGAPRRTQSARRATTARSNLTARVPAPTGPFPVGTRTLILTDRARADPFPAGRQPRRVLIQVYYPAAERAGRRARYLAAKVAKALAAPSIPASVLATVRTGEIKNARARRGAYPVLLFSPGYSVPHGLYTALLTDLASRGYVVIALDHTYETEAVQFPDGSVARRLLPANPRNTLVAIKARVGDMTYVLNELRMLRRHGSIGSPDLRRIGTLGHSLGGLTAATVASEHPAVRCSADLAGSVYGDAKRQPFRRPFLILNGPEAEATLPGWWANLKGVRYWVTLESARHLDFTDWTWLNEALRARGYQPRIIPPLGTISPRRAVSLTRSYVSAFFDSCLKGRPTDAFDDSRPAPDIRIKR
jgi:dienelactone hydrolase